MFGLKNILGPQKVRSKKILGKQKIMLPKQFWGQDNFWVKKKF